MKQFLTIIIIAIIFTSCIPNKDMVYFQGEMSENESIQKMQNTPYKLQVNDILDVQIKSSDKDLVAVFNTTDKAVGGTQQLTDERLYFDGYSVDRDGNIRLPYLGYINVLGYTTREVREKIEKEFENYFKNPQDIFITVKLAGIRFTVLGEVANTGSKVLYLNKVNLVEAIATAGDITITGNRKTISIFRRDIEGTKRYEVDMLDIASFDSENFFIQSNDIIYVAPLKQKSWGTGTNGMQTLTSLITILSLVTTTILLINTL